MCLGSAERRGLAGLWQAGFRACQVRKHSDSHVLEVLGVLSVLVCPLENGIPFGRPADFQWQSLAVARERDPPALASNPLAQKLAPLTTSKNYEIILSKDLEKLYAYYQACI